MTITFILLLCAGFRVVTIFALLRGKNVRQRSENEHSVLLTYNLYEVIDCFKIIPYMLSL
jgi:hypothetical protein